MPKVQKKSVKTVNKLSKINARSKAKSVSKKLIKMKRNKLENGTKMRTKTLSRNILRHRVKKVFKNKSKIHRGVVYLGHVPHGFYEEEMRQFFSQFGQVTNINIPRSNRTGKYRGYAFVEFFYPDVAKIVAETMNNYLMFQKVLQAKYIPPKEQKPLCFRLRKYKTPLVARRRKFLRRENYRVLSEEENNEVVARLQKKLDEKKKKLQKLGLNYEFLISHNEPCSSENDVEIAQNELDCVKNYEDSSSENVSIIQPQSIKRRKKVSS